MSEHEQSAIEDSIQEEDTWVIADYDPRLETQITEPELKRPSAGWLVPITAGYIAAVFLLTPQLAKIGADDKEPVETENNMAITNKLNCQVLKPSLVGAARKVMKFAAKYPNTSEQQLRKDRIITAVSGQDETTEGKIRLVTKRDGGSRKVDPNKASFLAITHKSDDGAGNRQFESILIDSRANKWIAHEHTRYQSAGNRPFDDRRSSTNGESSLISDNTPEILEDAMFAIKFDYKLSTASPEDQDRSCNQPSETR